MARKRVSLSRTNRINPVNETYIGFTGYGFIYTKDTDSTNTLYYYTSSGQTYDLLDYNDGINIPEPLDDTDYTYIDIHTFTTGTTKISDKSFVNLKMPYGKSANIELWESATYTFENTKTKNLKIYDSRDNYLEKTISYTDENEKTYFHIPYGTTSTVIEMTYHGFGHYQHFSFKRITNPSYIQQYGDIQYRNAITGLTYTTLGGYDDAFLNYARQNFNTLYAVSPSLQNGVVLSKSSHTSTSITGNKWIYKNGSLFYSFRTNITQNTVSDLNVYPTWEFTGQESGYTTQFLSCNADSEPSKVYTANRSVLANGTVITTPPNELGIIYRKYQTINQVWGTISNKINGNGYPCANVYQKYGIGRDYYFCSLVESGETQTAYYFETVDPLLSTYVYSDNTATTPLSSGNYVLTDLVPAVGTPPSTGWTPTYKMIVGGSGIITQIEVCTGVTTQFSGYTGYTYFHTNEYGYIPCEFCDWVNSSGSTYPSNVLIRAYGGLSTNIEIGDKVEVDLSVTPIEDVVDGTPYPPLVDTWTTAPDGAYSNGNYNFIVESGFVTDKKECASCLGLVRDVYFFDGTTGLTGCCQTCSWTMANDSTYNSEFIVATNGEIIGIGVQLYWDTGSDTTENILADTGDFSNRRTGIMEAISSITPLKVTDGVTCYSLSTGGTITGITSCTAVTSGQTAYIPDVYYFNATTTYTDCCAIYNFIHNSGYTVNSYIGLKSDDLCTTGITIGTRVLTSENIKPVEDIITEPPPYETDPYVGTYAEALEGFYSDTDKCYQVGANGVVTDIVDLLPPAIFMYAETGNTSDTCFHFQELSGVYGYFPFATLFKIENGLYKTEFSPGDVVYTDTSIKTREQYIAAGGDITFNCVTQLAPDGYYCDGLSIYRVNGGSGVISNKVSC
jgi:hypothetical protein